MKDIAALMMRTTSTTTLSLRSTSMQPWRKTTQPFSFRLSLTFAKACGMNKLIKNTGLGRESLYKALALGAMPRYDSVFMLLRNLGRESHTTPVCASQT